MKNFVNGEILTESDVDIYLVNTITAIKSAAESVISSTTLQDDDELFLPLAANSVYEISGLLNYDGPAAADLKLAFTGPAGASITMFVSGLTVGAAAGTDDLVHEFEAFGSAAVFGTIAQFDHRPLRFCGIVKIAGTAGNLRIQWAQNTSNATATRLFADSYMVARRIS